MHYKSSRKFSHKHKLVLSIALLSIAGLIIVYIIVNTTLRTIIYDNVIGVTHSNVSLIAHDINSWFEVSNTIVKNLSGIWVDLGVDYIEPIASILLDEHHFLSEILVGFSDGSLVGRNYWVPDDDWTATARPWYIAAKSAGGEIIITTPYLSSIENQGIVTTVAKWVPDMGGMEAVVGLVISLDSIIDMVNEHSPIDDGYLILIGPCGTIVSHPQIEYLIGVDSSVYLDSIPNGMFMMENIRAGNGISEFDDQILGQSYFMAFHLDATDWNLLAVVSTDVVLEPVSHYLMIIMLALGAVVVALLLLSMFSVIVLTRNMEEGRRIEERLRIIIDNMPLVTNFRDRNFNILECNDLAWKLFDLSSKEEYNQRFFELSPEFQPDGRLSDEKSKELISKAFEVGTISFEWLHQKLSGEPIPTEVTLSRVEWHNGEHLMAYVRDLREFYKYKETERIARQRLQTMLDSSPLLVTIFSEECRVLETNQVAERLFEIPDKQQYIDDYFAFSPKFQPSGITSRKAALDMLNAAIEHGSSKYEWTYKTSSGELIPCEETTMCIKLEGENMLIAYTRDLREFYKYKETERIATQRLHAMLNSSPLACSIIDEHLNVLEANDASARLFCLADANEYIEKFFELSPENQPDGRLSREKMFEKLHICLNLNSTNFEWMHQTLDGKAQIPCEITLERVIIDSKVLVIAYINDLREINKAAAMVAQLEKAAFTDALTGVKNRRYFMDEAEKALKNSIKNKQEASLIMIDVDNFKTINDTYGHPAGDEVLKILVARIAHSLKKETLVARYGGEEFIILLPGSDADSALGAAERIRRNVEASNIVTGENELAVTISLGIASTLGQGISLDKLISNADKALYHAKQSGRNKVVAF